MHISVNLIFDPKVNSNGVLLDNVAVINATVANGEVVIDKAQPHEIARAASVGSTGKFGKFPSNVPKNTDIIIGLTPSHENGTITTDKKINTMKSGRYIKPN